MANALPFNSIDHDRVYKAEDWAWYFATFIGNGVFPKPTNGLMVMADGAMNVAVKAGYGFINGYAFRNQDDHVITIATGDGSLGRIDRIVLRWDLTNRQMVLDVLQGTPSADPQPVALTRTADTYELALADISVTKGMTTISQANITDRRTNPDLCGIVEGTVSQIDWATLVAQLDAFMADYKQQVSDDYDAYVEDIETYEAAFKAALEGWEADEKQSFEDWWDDVKDLLDPEPAGQLALAIQRLRAQIDAEIEHEFKRFYSLANRATSFTRNADGSLATATSENEDEDVTCVSTFNRNADGSLSSVVTVVTPDEGNFYYTQTATFTRNADGSLLSVAEAYTRSPKE